MKPKPDHGEESYGRCGKVEGRVATITEGQPPVSAVGGRRKSFTSLCARTKVLEGVIMADVALEVRLPCLEQPRGFGARFLRLDRADLAELAEQREQLRNAGVPPRRGTARRA